MLYNYLPRNEDELELREGDVVDVMEKCDDGWFVGKKSPGPPYLLLLKRGRACMTVVVQIFQKRDTYGLI